MRIGSFTAVDFSRSIGCINCAIAVAAKPITKPNTDNIRGLGCRLMPPQFTDLRVRAGRVLYGSLSRCFVHRMDLACAAGKIESFADLVSM